MGLVPSSYALLRNMRAYREQLITARGGIIPISNVHFDQNPVHSVRRLNSILAGAGTTVSQTFKRIYGSGTKLYVGEGTAAVDTGYSGNPLAMFAYQPDQSPQPWMYVGDSLRMQKVRVDGLLHSIGIEPPLGAPGIGYGPEIFVAISSFSAVGAWTNGGTAGALSAATMRLNKTIGTILYDFGGVGWACVKPNSWPGAALGQGMLITVNGGGGTAEQVLVNKVTQAFPATSIAAITYDTGTAGLCTIQPAQSTVASKNAGMTGPIATPIRARIGQFPVSSKASIPPSKLHLPGPQPIGGIPVRSQSTEAVGLQQDMLIELNPGGGADEFVRVLSVSHGPNGQTSFRCSTVNTHAAGETMTGVQSFRAYFVNNHAAAETLTDGSLSSNVGAGIGFLNLVSAFNLTVAPPNPIQETDTINLGLLMDHPEFLTEAKIFFDVDSATNNFTQNYFYATLRPSDNQQAVLSGSTALQARQAAITLGTTELYSRQGVGIRRIGPISLLPNNSLGLTNSGATDARMTSGGAIGSSRQARTGQSQWTQFSFKIRDLTRVGSDTAQTLANVAAIRIQFQVSAAMNIQVADLWIGGTYGPDIGDIGSPLFYRFRGRSKLTGAKSLAGPPTRMSLEPHGQRVVVTPQQHPNASADTLDIFRWGGSLLQWTYVGNCPNGATPQFFDDLSDTDIANNPLLDVDVFQPFPTIDLPRSGICTVAGTKLTRVSGDILNTRWYPGTQININGTYYSLYAQPPGDGTLELVENAGTQGFSFPNAGPNVAGAGANTGAGTAWTNPNNITQNVTFATVALGLTFSKEDIGSGFGFAIPGGATILGIEVSFTGEQSLAGNPAAFFTAIIKKAGVTVAGESFGGIPTGPTLITLGGPTDLWGSTWTPADINNANFGFSILASNALGSGASTFSIRNAQITVFYQLTSGVPFFINQATLLAQPLYAFWGPYAEGSASFFFGCGDPYQPGVLFITNGNNPDAASDTLQIGVCSPSEPLVNGCMKDGIPFVWSSDRFYKLNPNLGSAVTSPTILDPSAVQLFVPYKVSENGLFAPWAFCAGDLIYYLGKDGIYGSNGASSASITDEDLYFLFPHDGQPGQQVTVGSLIFFPPDMTQTAKLRLSFVDGHLYFDYQDTNGTQRTLVYNPSRNVWGQDNYNPGVGVNILTHYADEGKGVHGMILGGNDGLAYIMSGVNDNGNPIPCDIFMPTLSEREGGYEMFYDGFLGLQALAAGIMNLIIIIDGAQSVVSLPVTTEYRKPRVVLNPIKGKLTAFSISSVFPFTLFQRDCEFQCGLWGRDGAMEKINPFANLRRPLSPKIG